MVGLALLGLLSRTIVYGDQSWVGRSALILPVLLALLCEGALTMVLTLGLALVLTATEDRPDCLSPKAWFMAMSSRSRVVRGFT